MERTVSLGVGLPAVCRLGLATRGNTHLKAEDVEWAVSRGINYLNWCGHSDGLSCAIARMGGARKRVVVAAQFEARSAREAGTMPAWATEVWARTIRLIREAMVTV